MDLLVYALIACISLSISSCILWFLPIINEAKSNDVVNTFTKHPLYSALIYCVVSTLVAPVLILPMFSGRHEARLISGLRKEIYKPD